MPEGSRSHFRTPWLYVKPSGEFNPSASFTYISEIQKVFFDWGRGARKGQNQAFFLFLLGPRGFHVPSAELRGFHGTLEPFHIRPCFLRLNQFFKFGILRGIYARAYNGR